MNIADEIKRRVTVRDVCNLYGIPVNQSGFACCIAHNEKTPSMKVYEGANGFHCFGCGVTGDVITFVKMLFNISFLEALQKLNMDFSLGLLSDKQLTQREKIAIAKENYERKKQLEERKKQIDESEAEYWRAFEEWKKYDDNLNKYAPKNIDDEIDDRWVEAVNNIDRAKEAVYDAEQRWRENAKRSY